MKKFTTAIAAAFSASMIASAGIATAQIPAPMPTECPAGQHFENVDGTFQCVADQPEQDSTDGIPAPMPDKCPDGQHFENVGGTFQCVADKEAPKPETPGNNESQPGNLGNPGISDKQCPEGEHFDMSKPAPGNPNVFGVCVKDETKPDTDKPGKGGKPGKDGKDGKDVKVNVDIKISTECKNENKWKRRRPRKRPRRRRPSPRRRPLPRT